MSDVIPINRSRALIEHKAFVAGVEAAARAAEQHAQMTTAERARFAAQFAGWLRRHAHQLADMEVQP